MVQARTLQPSFGNRNFKKVHCQKSPKGFFYESGRLFSDNYKCCHYGYTVNGGQRQMYKLLNNETRGRNKLEDALIYKCYHENFSDFDNKAYIIALRTREMGGSLVQYDIDTGQLVREIFLSHTVKFKYIAWAEVNEMFYVKSTHSAERTRFIMEAGISTNFAILLAVFSAFPIKFIGMFKVDKQVFGAGITSVMLTNGMLVVMYITGHVKFFSFADIVKKYKTFEHNQEPMDSLINVCCGDGPLGLPMNIKITECPPVLLEVRCENQDVQIGGFPWQYIYTPKGEISGMFEIALLKDKTQVKGGSLSPRYMNPEPDSCIFHGDESGRILHVSGSELKVLQFHPEESTQDRLLKVVCTMNVEKSHETIPQEIYRKLLHSNLNQLIVERPMMTSSGRCVKRRQSLDEVSYGDTSLVHSVMYEDDLDMTLVVVTSPASTATVRFYDNQKFDLLKEVHLEATNPAEIYEYNVYVDLDTIVEVIKPSHGQFICNVYRLSGDLNQENQSDRLGSGEKKSRENIQLGNRRSSRTRTR